MNIIDNIYSNIFENIYKNIGYGYGDDYEDYSFFCDFVKSQIDKVSEQPLVVEDLASGRVTYDGTVAGEDEATIDEDGLLSYAGYSNLLPWSEDFAVWQKYIPDGIGSIVITPHQIDPLGEYTSTRVQISLNSIGGRASLRISTSINNLNTNHLASMWITNNGGSDTMIFDLYNYNTITITDSWQQYTRIVQSPSTPANYRIGLRSGYATNDIDILVWHPQLTLGTLDFPYIKTESTAVAVAENYSTTDHGYSYPVVSAWDGTGSETAWNDCKENLVDVLDGEADGVELLPDLDFTTWININFIRTTNTLTTDGSLACYIRKELSETINENCNISLTGSTTVDFALTDYDISPRLYYFSAGDTFDIPIRYLFVNNKKALGFIVSTGNAGTITIDNISVQKVQPATGQINIKWQPRFNAGEVPFGDDIPRTLVISSGSPIITGDVIEFGNEIQSIKHYSYWSIGKTYKVNCTVSDFVGTGYVYLPYNGAGNDQSVGVNTDGVYEYMYKVIGATNLSVYSTIGHTATVTINSIREVIPQNILTTNNTIESLCWYDDLNEKLKTTDGTNTAEVDCTPVSGTTYNAKINYDELGLRISTDENTGTLVPFEGRFPTDNDLKISYEAEAPQYVKLLNSEKEFEFDTFEFTVSDDTPTISGVFSTASASDEIVVDWGDGSTFETFSGTDLNYSHTYAESVEHVVSIIDSLNMTKFTMIESGADVSFDVVNLPDSVTYFNCQGSNTVSGDVATLPDGLTSFSCYGYNTVSGDVVSLPDSVTYFNCQGSNTVSGDVIGLPDSLTSFSCYGYNTVSGDLSGLPDDLTYFQCYGSNTVSGDISGLPDDLIYFRCYGSNTVSGDLSGLPDDLIYFECFGSNTVSGDISGLPDDLTNFQCYGSNTISDYTSGRSWDSAMQYVVTIPISGGLSSTEVDNLLIDLSSTTWTSYKVITLLGTNAARTNASDSAVATLQAMGVTVTTYGPYLQDENGDNILDENSEPITT